MKNETPSLSDVDMVVLCGGLGTRLGKLTAQVPKPLLEIGGEPFLLRLLLQWKQEGIQRFILAIHYLSETFYDFAERYEPLIGKLDFAVESEPLGTGGGLKNALQKVKSRTFLAANGDSYVSQPLAPLLQLHQKSKHDFALIAIPPTHVVGGARQKGRLLVTPDGNLQGFSTEEQITDGWVNAGVYAINASEIARWPEGKFDLEKKILNEPAIHPVTVLKSNGYLMDIGLPDCFDLFNRQLGPTNALFSRLKNLSQT